MSRIEQNPLGSVFVCSYGSSRHGPGGCKRTYLSYRDMEAHIKHRHKKKDASATGTVQPMQPQQNQIMALSQPPLNLNQPPPHPFMRPHMPHLVSHPPPGIIPTTNVPPPGLPVSMPQGHVQTIQTTSINMHGNPSNMQPNPHNPMQNMSMQPSPQSAHPQRHPIQSNPIPAHHNMMASGPPMQPHQQIQGAPPHQLRHVRPQQHNPPPAVTSKSHGNLISIPIQGSQNWSGQGQQQWPNQSQGGQQQHHRQGQYNS